MNNVLMMISLKSAVIIISKYWLQRHKSDVTYNNPAQLSSNILQCQILMRCCDAITTKTRPFQRLENVLHHHYNCYAVCGSMWIRMEPVLVSRERAIDVAVWHAKRKFEWDRRGFPSAEAVFCSKNTGVNSSSEVLVITTLSSFCVITLCVSSPQLPNIKIILSHLSRIIHV